MLFPLESHSHLHDPHTALPEGHAPALGPEVLLNDSGMLSPVNASRGGGTTSSSGSSSAPAPTLVTALGSTLEIDLVWDSSVGAAPSGFMAAVIGAAKTYVTDFTSAASAGTSNIVEVFIKVGWGEVAGSQMSSSALGTSQSYGYLTNYAAVTKALSLDGFSFNAANEPTNAQFFVTSAQAKALGMISGTSGSATSPDGYIGFSTLSGTGYSWNYGSSGTTSTQYNLQSVVEHEISEVMGRIGMQGTQSYSRHASYTPLDLFDYSSSNHLMLSGAGGYFSNNGGLTNQGNFNNAAKYGGDIADWASYASVSQSGTVPAGQADAFNAFDAPGYNGTLSASDLLELAALGYKFTSTGNKLV